MTSAEIQEAVEGAFADVPFPRSWSLRQAREVDDWVSDPEKLARAREQDYQGDWSGIADADLYKYADSLPYLEPDGILYYLPAFMSYCLRHASYQHDATRLGNVLFRLLFVFEHYVENKRCFSLLTDRQRSTIQLFLEWFADYGNNKTDRASAKRALRTYWHEFKDWTA